MPKDDPEAYLNAFERTTETDSWLESQWMAVLIPCLAGPTQQATDTISASDVTNYKKSLEYHSSELES